MSIIAHSQGTTQTFAMLSRDKEHSNKVNAFIALAPVVYFDDFNPLRFEPVVSVSLNPLTVRTAGKGVQVAAR